MPDTITVPTNDLKQFNVRSGETFENKLIDITANGAGVYIDARGDGWTIRNIGIRGAQGKPSVQIKVAVENGGNALIENVYMGDGHDMSQSGDMKAGILAHADQNGSWPHHRGTCTFRHINIQGFGDGIYMSGPAVWTNSNAGSSIIESCYGRSNNVAQFRVAKSGDVVRDSVALAYQGETPANPRGVVNGRGIRAVDGDGTAALAVNCDVQSDWVGFQAASGSKLRVRNCRADANPNVGGDVIVESLSGGPNTSIPAGVPRDATEAASGGTSGGGGGGGSTLDNTITILGSGTSDVTNYEFDVSGDVEGGPNANLNKEDSISGSTVTGGVASNGTDDYRFSGSLTRFVYTGPEPSVTVNGSPVAIPIEPQPGPTQGLTGAAAGLAIGGVAAAAIREWMERRN